MAAAAKAKKKTSIGRRIAIMVSLVVVATVFCISGLLASYQAIDGARSKRQSVEAIAFVYASAVADHVASRDSFQILSVLRSVDRVPGVISASVIDSQGNNLGTLGQKAMLESDVAGSDPSFFEMMSTGAVPVSVNIIKNGQVQGTLILVTDISDLRTRFLLEGHATFLERTGDDRARTRQDVDGHAIELACASSGGKPRHGNGGHQRRRGQFHDIHWFYPPV
jgi:hypothetical protein